MDPGDFLHVVERALAAPLPGPAERTGSLPRLPGSVVLLLLDGAALPAVSLALPPLLHALGGTPLHPPLLVVAREDDVRCARPEAARWLAPAAAQATLVVHDPDGSHEFRPGFTSDGWSIELDDVLLEAELLVTVGPIRRDERGAVLGGAGLVFPGLASRRTRELHRALDGGRNDPGARARRWRQAEEIRAHVPVDYQLCWVEGEGGIEAWAGPARAAEAAARRALGGRAAPRLDP